MARPFQPLAFTQETSSCDVSAHDVFPAPSNEGFSLSEWALPRDSRAARETGRSRRDLAQTGKAGTVLGRFGTKPCRASIVEIGIRGRTDPEDQHTART